MLAMCCMTLMVRSGKATGPKGDPVMTTGVVCAGGWMPSVRPRTGCTQETASARSWCSLLQPLPQTEKATSKL